MLFSNAKFLSISFFVCILVLSILSIGSGLFSAAPSELPELITQTQRGIHINQDILGFVVSTDQSDVPDILKLQATDQDGNFDEYDLWWDTDGLDQKKIRYSKIFFTSGLQTLIFPQTMSGFHVEWLRKEPKGLGDQLRSLVPISFADTGFSLFSRASWGADETLRYLDPNTPPSGIADMSERQGDAWKQYAGELEITKVVTKENGQELLWPLEYAKTVKKIVVHHSAGRMPSCDEEAEVIRAIYRYHTIKRAWGDIGYNYIVGTCSGKVYEGRAGGFGVVAGHARGHNIGSSGVMLMGNFSQDIPSAGSLQALAHLIKYLGEHYRIDPIGESKFRGVLMPNVIGHRDVGSTSCPGDHLQAQLPDIRNKAKQNFRDEKNYYGSDIKPVEIRKVAYAVTPFSSNLTSIVLKPGASTELSLLFKNIGLSNWSSETYLRVDGDTKGLTFGEGFAASKVSKINQAMVKTKNLGTFDIHISAAPDITLKAFNLSFVPVLNGSSVVLEGAQNIRIIVSDAVVETKVSDSPESEIAVAPPVVNPPKPKPKPEQPSTENKPSLSSDWYHDLDKNSEFSPFVEKLRERGVVTKDRIHFEPKRPISRAEFAKLLVLSADLKEGDKSFRINDIPLESDFYPYVRILQTNDIVARKSKFRPDDPILRQEAIKMVVNAFGLKGKSSHVFHDMRGTLFESYVDIATANNLIAKKTLFYGKNLITRQESAKLLVLARDVKLENKDPEYGEKPDLPPVPNPDTPTTLVKEGEEHFGPRIRTQVGFQSSQIVLIPWHTFSLQVGPQVIAEDIEALTKLQFDLIGGITKLSFAGRNIDTYEAIRIISKDPAAGVIRVDNWTRPQSDYGGRPDVTFRDTIEIRKDPEKDELYVINELPLERYLWGLGEEPNGMPHEKNKTIAVLARSYAYYYQKNGGKHPAKFSHLISTGADQVYKGYNYEQDHEEFVNSVKETWGKMIYHQGEVIRAPFFSQSNGRTKQAGSDGNTWNFKTFPFTQSVSDPWSCGGTSQDINAGLRCDENQRGHGVGLSAKGAFGLAHEGKNFIDIIGYFFRDVVVKEGY